MVILAWAAIVLMALAAAGLLILAVPVELTFRAARGDGTRPRFSVRWLFGLVHRDFDARKKDEMSEPAEEEKDEAEKGGESSGSGRMPPVDVLMRLVRLGWRLLRTIELREFVLHGRFGTGDPGQTGILYGMSYVVTGPVNRRPRVDIRLTPSYVDAVLEGEVRGTLRLVPLRLLWPIVWFSVRPSNWRAMGQLRKAAA